MDKIKVTALSILFLFVAIIVSAQEGQVTIAYVNTNDLMEAFPAKEEASLKLERLSNNYKSELELMQNEYNKKYSDYITYQSSLSENIKLRRMQELTELENKMQQFMNLAQQDIQQQEIKMLEPLREKISYAIREVGIEYNFTVIYDLADPSILFVNPSATDATSLVKQKLNIR